ncbi:MAG: lysophospholipid acyltransferase family protein, partial [Spirochaetota bacterium]|nr:lysophospholipid acyltransferase family protein [Spirochaetota bacterium]
LRKNSFIEGSKALKNNELLAFLIDQNQARGGIFVPFFGKLASSPRGPALMAKRFKSPVMGTYIKRNPDSTHTVTFKEIKLVESSSIKEYLYTNTYNFSNFFEELIRENPDQWYWFHNRWKTQTKVRYGKDNLV